MTNDQVSHMEFKVAPAVCVCQCVCVCVCDCLFVSAWAAGAGTRLLVLSPEPWPRVDGAGLLSHYLITKTHQRPIPSSCTLFLRSDSAALLPTAVLLVVLVIIFII